MRRLAAALVLGAIAAAAGLLVLAGRGDDSAPEPSAAAQLNVRELAGQRLIAGFEGPALPDGLRRMIARGELAGVVLFSDNFSGPATARRLARRLQAIRRPRLLRIPLLIAIDQEGGEIRRLPGPPEESAAAIGARGAAFARGQGRLTAQGLRAAGVNVDLAPVLDVARPGSAIGSEQRSFGADPASVSAVGGAFAAGLREGGVAATAKHFPGLGAAEVNTDFGVERIGLPAADLRRVDAAPFASFVDAGGKLVMLSTAIYPALSSRPAVLSRQIATGELRDRLGFTGVSISDDLQSVAARSFGSPAGLGVTAAGAGTDLLLFRHYGAAGEAGAGLEAAIRRGRIGRKQAVAAAQRVIDLRVSPSD
jgi:beta-N-acetylhexosaminidase